MSMAVAGCAMPAMADVTLMGKFIEIGVNNGGSLINFDQNIGIKFDPLGTGDFSSSNDFITPGSPFAFYSIGVNGVSGVAGGGSGSNPFGTMTLDLSAVAGSPLSITKNGTFEKMSFKQIISFDMDSKIVHTAVTLTNKSDGILNKVVYGVGFDPDQDVSFNGDYSTVNTINGQGVDASVVAVGSASGYSIALNNTTGWTGAHASITSPWGTDPYTLSSAAAAIDNIGDYAIALGFQLGDFAIDQQKTVGYDYVLSCHSSMNAVCNHAIPAPTPPPGPLPEPETYTMLLTGLGLMGFMVRRRKTS